jgi:hypothetical protein
VRNSWTYEAEQLTAAPERQALLAPTTMEKEKHLVSMLQFQASIKTLYIALKRLINKVGRYVDPLWNINALSRFSFRAQDIHEREAHSE